MKPGKHVFMFMALFISALILSGCGGGSDSGTTGGGGFTSDSGGTGTTTTTSSITPEVSSCDNLTSSGQALRSGDWCQVSGSGFGSSQDVNAGSVVFTDGTVSIPATLYSSWSDALIVCRVPEGIPTVNVTTKVILLSGASSVGITVSVNATPNPSPQPTPPIVTPTPSPTTTPTPGPTTSPTPAPTTSPTPGPTTSPTPGPTTSPTPGPTKPPNPDGGTMNIETTLSEQGQKYTIAFDGLAFLTGILGADSFLPPGKVADYAGFQYLRDNDPTGLGHNTDFVTIVATNMLNIFSTDQINQLITAAKSQITPVNDYAYKRFYLMKGFRRLLEGDIPSGTTGLSKTAVMAYSAAIYKIDGQISIDRAKLYGGIIRSMTTEQKAKMDALKAKNGVGNWDKTLTDPLKGMNLDKDVNVQVMTYASEMYSWYAGSVEADVYFCPERQATYFGSFYMKDGVAMGNPDYSIGTNITGDYGEAFLKALTTDQAALVTSLVDTQKTDLNNIVSTREAISIALRRFMTESSPDEAGITSTVLNLSATYGEEDGAIVYYYATNFAAVGKTTSAAQKTQLMALRKELLGNLAPTGAYLYSAPISMPTIDNTDGLFGTTTP